MSNQSTQNVQYSEAYEGNDAVDKPKDTLGAIAKNLFSLAIVLYYIH